jgi:4-hydroxy-tetrahydrodipicolinate reductase
MTELVLHLPDLEATRTLGRALAGIFGGPGSVLALEGPLGAGKTSLAKAYIARIASVAEDDVTSPTFVIANEYPGVLHLDAYRLGHGGDLVSLGYQLEGAPRAVVIEWGSRVETALPRERLEVELFHAAEGREARLRAHGARVERALEAVAKETASMQTLALALSGATGRMGKAVTAVVAEAGSGFEIAQALSRGDALQEGADVVIDFSTAEGLARRAREAMELGVPLVGCATGLGEKELAAIDAAASRIPVLYAANTSLGVTLLRELVARAVAALRDFDVEIVELHHNKKKDAPSGTALLLSEAVLEAAPGRSLVHGRAGKTERAKTEVGVHALRLGDGVGEHRVYLAGPGERIELAHVATSRETFARGALRAARWLVGRPAGRYSMKDVIS